MQVSTQGRPQQSKLGITPISGTAAVVSVPGITVVYLHRPQLALLQLVTVKAKHYVHNLVDC